MTDLKQLAENLRRYNAWRRDEDPSLKMPNMKDLGEWIDSAAGALESLTAERDALTAELKSLREQEPIAWFCHSNDGGYYEFSTFQAAAGCASDELAECLAEAKHDGEWPEDVVSIKFGAVLGRVTELKGETDGEGWVDYQLIRPVPAEPVNARLLDSAKAALEALTCSGEQDDPGHRCGHCDDYVDRNGAVRASLRSVIAAAEAQQAEPFKLCGNCKYLAKECYCKHPGFAANCIDASQWEKAEPEQIDVDALSNFIRAIDGRHTLGAGQLAEKIAEYVQGIGERNPIKPVRLTNEQISAKWQSLIQGKKGGTLFDIARAIETATLRANGLLPAEDQAVEGVV